jgi:hypothetical protein
MKEILNIFLILISALSFSQNSSESEIFKKIIGHEVGKGNFGIYIQCEKSKTYFENNDFNEQTGLKVPEKILKEIKINGIKSSDGIWNSKLINDLNYGTDFIIKTGKCLTKKDAEQIFKKTRKRQNIISISEPIFDNNYENCIVSVSYSKFTGSAYGHKYFLKKVYGVWTVIVEYEQWMT